MAVPFDIIFVVAVLAVLMLGYPVALTLGGMSVVFAMVGWAFGLFDPALFYAVPSRIFGVMTNGVLIAIPLFVFMGLVLQSSKIAEDMFRAAAQLFRRFPGGLTVSVTVVGTLMAASTGIVGASVVTLSVLALPTMIDRGVPKSMAAGTVAAAGTLGQLIPPSIVLIVLGDQISNAYQDMQTRAGNFAPDTVAVSDLFAGALLPGFLLAAMFVAYQIVVSPKNSLLLEQQPEDGVSAPVLLRAFLPPLLLIVLVLGSILTGVATPTEAASVGAVGSIVLAWKKLTLPVLRKTLEDAVHLISVIFLIVIGATIFSLVFRGLGGDETVAMLLSDLPGGTYGALFVVMLAIFVLGFFLDFLEISLVVVPLVAPVILAMPMGDGSAMSPVWLGVLIAINLQTSFLTPPFGVALFYLRSAASDLVTTGALYKGVIPFVILQLLALAAVVAFPQLATFLPTYLYGG